jgi:hypothetical protein
MQALEWLERNAPVAFNRRTPKPLTKSIINDVQDHLGGKFSREFDIDLRYAKFLLFRAIERYRDRTQYAKAINIAFKSGARAVGLNGEQRELISAEDAISVSSRVSRNLQLNAIKRAGTANETAVEEC